MQPPMLLVELTSSAPPIYKVSPSITLYPHQQSPGVYRHIILILLNELYFEMFSRQYASLPNVLSISYGFIDLN